MYEYRRLTPQERKKIVALRISRGYPPHAPPHPFRGEGYYFISAANFEHQTIMNSIQRRTEFEIALLEKFRDINASVDGWVILPNHYHLLAQVESLDLVSQQLQKLHGATSHQWNREDGLQNKRKVWYRFSDRMIRNEWHYFATLNYIHHNPVRHKCCRHANEWMWSSIHLYLEDYGKDWLVDKWNRFKPGEKFGRGWDDFDD